MIPNRIDLNLLHVFCAILDTRSVTVAASNLGLTQSAVSNQLARLRGAFDDPLFVRTSEGMVPTPKAQAIAEPIRRSLSAIQQCVDAQLGFDPATSDRTFRIFMSDIGQMVFLPQVLQHCAKHAPRVNIHIVQVPAPRQRDMALESGDVDLAISNFEDFEGAFRQQTLFEERFVGMVRRGHPTIGGMLTLEAFLNTPQLVYQPNGGELGGQEDTVEQAFNDAGAPRRVAVRAAHALGLTHMIASSNLLVVLPSRLAAGFKDLTDVRVFDLPVDIPTFQVRQFWHDRFHQDPGNCWLRNLFAGLFQETRMADVPVAVQGEVCAAS